VGGAAAYGRGLRQLRRWAEWQIEQRHPRRTVASSFTLYASTLLTRWSSSARLASHLPAHSAGSVGAGGTGASMLNGTSALPRDAQENAGGGMVSCCCLQLTRRDTRRAAETRVLPVLEPGEGEGKVLDEGARRLSRAGLQSRKNDACSVFPHCVCLRFTTLPSRCNLTEMSFHSL
jgi:hypothetical protein